MDLMEAGEKTSIGLDVDVACIGCYLAGPISGALMLWLEKRDLLVRFHAVQSCLLFGPSFVVIPIYFLLPSPASPGARFVYYMFGALLVLATIALFFLILPAAWRLERKRLPVVGRIADRWIPDDGRSEAYDFVDGPLKEKPKADLSQLTFESIPPTGQADQFLALIPAGISSKEVLLKHVADSLKFPGDFGGTWDALDDCLNDLSWLPEKRVTIFHPDLPLANKPAELKTYLGCLGDAVAAWKSKGRVVKAVFPPASRAELQKGQQHEAQRRKV